MATTKNDYYNSYDNVEDDIDIDINVQHNQAKCKWLVNECVDFLKICIKRNIIEKIDTKKIPQTIVFTDITEELSDMGYIKKTSHQAQIKFKRLRQQYYLAIKDKKRKVRNTFYYFDLMDTLLKNRILIPNGKNKLPQKLVKQPESPSKSNANFETDHNYTELDPEMHSELYSELDPLLDNTNVSKAITLSESIINDNRQKLNEVHIDEFEEEYYESDEAYQPPAKTVKFNRKKNFSCNKINKSFDFFAQEMKDIQKNIQNDFFKQQRIILDQQNQFELELQDRDDRRNKIFLEELTKLFEPIQIVKSETNNTQQQQLLQVNELAEQSRTKGDGGGGGGILTKDNLNIQNSLNNFTTQMKLFQKDLQNEFFKQQKELIEQQHELEVNLQDKNYDKNSEFLDRLSLIMPKLNGKQQQQELKTPSARQSLKPLQLKTITIEPIQMKQKFKNESDVTVEYCQLSDNEM